MWPESLSAVDVLVAFFRVKSLCSLKSFLRGNVGHISLILMLLRFQKLTYFVRLIRGAPPFGGQIRRCRARLCFSVAEFCVSLKLNLLPPLLNGFLVRNRAVGLRGIPTCLIVFPVTAFTMRFRLSPHLEGVVRVIEVRHLLSDHDVGHTSMVLTRHPKRRIPGRFSKFESLIATGIVKHRFGLYVILVHSHHFVF